MNKEMIKNILRYECNFIKWIFESIVLFFKEFKEDTLTNICILTMLAVFAIFFICAPRFFLLVIGYFTLLHWYDMDHGND